MFGIEVSIHVRRFSRSGVLARIERADAKGTGAQLLESILVKVLDARKPLLRVRDGWRVDIYIHIWAGDTLRT